MFVRNLLLLIGALCLVGGVALSVIWYNQIRERPGPGGQQPRAEVLVAARAIPTGTLLRAGDLGWREVQAGVLKPGSLMRGQVSANEFNGAITRRPFAIDEPIIASDLVKPSERQFLSAVLKPGTRAVSIAVDAPQSVSGLVLPGDQVDVILTQNLGENAGSNARRAVAETVLRDVRVIAVDQSLNTTSKPPTAPASSLLPAQTRIPKTVTFELTDRQAERLFVAAQLGRLHLSVRPLQVAAGATEGPRKIAPMWGYQVSPALAELDRSARKPAVSNVASNSTVESFVRRPPPSTLQ